MEEIYIQQLDSSIKRLGEFEEKKFNSAKKKLDKGEIKKTSFDFDIATIREHINMCIELSRLLPYDRESFEYIEHLKTVSKEIDKYLEY